MRQQILGDGQLKNYLQRTGKQDTCSKQKGVARWLIRAAQPDAFQPSFQSNQLEKSKNLDCKNLFKLAWKRTRNLAVIACVCAKYCCYGVFLLLMSFKL